MKWHPNDKFNHDGKIDLKTPLNRSHNQISASDKLKKLAETLARRAAEDDFNLIEHAHRPHQSDIGGT